MSCIQYQWLTDYKTSPSPPTPALAKTARPYMLDAAMSLLPTPFGVGNKKGD